MLFVERRRVQRVKLIEPLRGSIGTKKVFVIDLSVRGLRVAHQEPIGRTGDKVTLQTQWDGNPLTLHCEIMRSQIHRMPETATAKTLYHSGLSIREPGSISAITLRELIHALVLRAMDEQKANARGIPPRAAQHNHHTRPTHYKRHELIAGRWRETETTDPSQPANGFTVSAEHSPEEVSMLQTAFENGDSSTGSRDLIRRLAKMSITSTESVPTRRFMP